MNKVRTTIASALKRAPVIGPRLSARAEARAQAHTELLERARRAERIESFHAYKSLYPLPPHPSMLVGQPNNEMLPVVMCLWNRPSRIELILDMLAGQEDLDRKIRLVFWNNCEADREHYERAISQFELRGALGSIEIVQSPRNIRGVGRFINARRLVDEGYRGSLIMLDDDEDIPADGVARLLASGGERTISSCWAWQADADDYWQRDRAEPGEWANYAATCGCVVDSELFGYDRFFRLFDEEGLYIEDVWMSRFALSLGWTLTASDAVVEFVMHDTNQYHGLVWDKVHYWRMLKTTFPLPEGYRREDHRDVEPQLGDGEAPTR